MLLMMITFWRYGYNAYLCLPNNIIKDIDYENNDCRCDYDRSYLHNFSM